MPITISGSGTVTGISAGGLPDDCITTAEIAAAAVTTVKLGSSEASGLAKAFVNFNGTGTVAIRASFNVSSITDNGVGSYTVNFTTALTDANYNIVGTVSTQSAQIGVLGSAVVTDFSKTTSAVTVATYSIQGTAVADFTSVNLAIFR